jgi:hypothetical protein
MRTLRVGETHVAETVFFNGNSDVMNVGATSTASV